MYFYFFFCSYLFEMFLILRRTEQYIIKMHIGLLVKYWLLLSDFIENLIFSTDLKKKLYNKFNENPSSGS
jgi:hypothetical protein